MAKWKVAVVGGLTWVAMGVAALAQGGGAPLPAIEQRLAGFADRARISLSVAAVAAFSPSVPDAHGHAERLIALLRGNGDDRPIGLVQEAALLSEWIAARSFDPEREEALRAAARNVQEFLGLALDASIQASRDRVLARATGDLFRAYAFLLAAWGEPVDGIVVPGLAAILRAFEIPLGSAA